MKRTILTVKVVHEDGVISASSGYNISGLTADDFKVVADKCREEMEVFLALAKVRVPKPDGEVEGAE